MVDDSRTVADALTDYEWRIWFWEYVRNMDADQFRHRLEMGERAEKAPVRDGPHRPWGAGWNACLDHIRGVTGA